MEFWQDHKISNQYVSPVHFFMCCMKFNGNLLRCTWFDFMCQCKALKMLHVYVRMVLSLWGITLFVTFKSLFILMNFNAHFDATSRTIEQTWCLCIPWQTRWFAFPAPPIFLKGKSLGTRLNLSSLFVALGSSKTHSIAIQLVLRNVAKQIGRFLLPVLLNLK